jgi:prepilin signal peptidase PulO-like enzyme (type II secretory pathway)
VLEIFSYFLLFMFGASLGSFANVFADRYRVKKISNSRSKCLHCSKILKWYHMIPVFSYLYYRGRCGYCNTRLTPTYFFSEIFLGSLILFLPNVIGMYTDYFAHQVFMFVILSVVFCMSLSIIIYDIRHKIVPEVCVAIIFLLGIILTLSRIVFDGFNIYDALSGVIVALPFAVLHFASRGRLVGMGDVVTYMALGFVFGLPIALTGFFYSVWLGAFVSLILILIYRKEYNMKTELPFTPFIILGMFLAFYSKADIFNLYAMLF